MASNQKCKVVYLFTQEETKSSTKNEIIPQERERKSIFFILFTALKTVECLSMNK